MSFCPGNLVQMPSGKLFNYHSELGYGCSWAILFWAKYAPNSKSHSGEDSEVDNLLEKHILLTLWRM